MNRSIQEKNDSGFRSDHATRVVQMTLREVADLLEAEVISGEDGLDEPVEFAGASDLMSDVLAFGKPGVLLLTGLASLQSVRTAEIIDAKAIVYVRGKRPSNEGLARARERRMPILSTKMFMFKACGLLHGRGVPDVGSR